MWENISDMAGKRLNIGSTRRLQAGIVVLRSTTYRSPSKLLKTVALKIVRQVKVRYENWAVFIARRAKVASSKRS